MALYKKILNAVKLEYIEHIDYRYEKILYILFSMVFISFFLLNTAHHRLILYITLPICLGHILHQKIWARIKFPYLAIIGALYLSLCTVSLLWSGGMDLERIIQKSKLIVFIPVFGLSLGYFCYKYRQSFTNFMTVLVAIAVPVALYIIINWFVTGYLNSGEFNRMSGFNRTNNPVVLGMYYSMATLVALLLPKNNIIFFDKIWLKYTAVMLLMTTVFLSGSRGPLLALSGTIFYLMILKKRFKTMAFILALVAILGGSIVLSSEDTLSMQNRLDNGRLSIWATTIERINEKLLVGYGVGHKEIFKVQTRYKFIDRDLSWEVGHPHNLYLSTIMHVGFIGFTIFLLTLLTLGIQSSLYGVIEQRFIPIAFVTFGGLVGFVDLGGYITNLSVEWLYFWIPLSIMIFLKPFSFQDFKNNYRKQ